MAKKKSSSRKLGVGIIGAGLMGKTHLGGLRDIIRRGLLPIRLAGIASLDHERGRAVAQEFDCEYFESGEELIAAEGIGAVVIATPTRDHLPLAKAVARAGKAIFLEKPMGRNLAEAKKIADAIRKAGVPHQIGLVLRFAPTYNVLKQLLADPKNGDFVFCRFRDDQFFPVQGVYGSNWRAEVDQAGGGALIEHSIHDVDVLHWFFGEPEVCDAMTLPSHAPGIEKLAALNIWFKKAGHAQLASIWHNNLARENERHIEIFCENRYYHTVGRFISPIEIQDGKDSGQVIGSEEIVGRYLKMIGWKDAKNADFPSTIGYEMYVFLKNVLEGRTASAVGVEVGLAAHQMIERSYRMAKAGRRR